MYRLFREEIMEQVLMNAIYIVGGVGIGLLMVAAMDRISRTNR